MARIERRVRNENQGRNQKNNPLFLSMNQLGLVILFALFLLSCGNNGKTKNDVADNTLNKKTVDSMRIDSAVLFSANSSKFYYTNHLYHRLPAKPEYESRLRQLYKHDHYALIALARYHREEDKQEIIRQLSQIENKVFFSYRDTIRTIMDAVAAWPSATYKQKVRQVCQNILDKKGADSYATSAFGALMAYNDRWSYNLIDKTLSNAKQRDKYYFDFCWSLHVAYENNPLPLFKPLLRKYPLKSGE